MASPVPTSARSPGPSTTSAVQLRSTPASPGRAGAGIGSPGSSRVISTATGGRPGGAAAAAVSGSRWGASTGPDTSVDATLVNRGRAAGEPLRLRRPAPPGSTSGCRCRSGGTCRPSRWRCCSAQRCTWAIRASGPGSATPSRCPLAVLVLVGAGPHPGPGGRRRAAGRAGPAGVAPRRAGGRGRPKPDKQVALGPQLDPAAFLMHRGWVGPVVRIEVTDPADPHAVLGRSACATRPRSARALGALSRIRSSPTARRGQHGSAPAARSWSEVRSRGSGRSWSGSR